MPKFTTEELELIEVLKKYGNRYNLQKKRWSLYKKLLKEYPHILDEALPSLLTTHTLESCKAEALKYNTRKEWGKGSRNSYRAAVKNKWLEECCKHMKISRDEQHKLHLVELKKIHDKGEQPPLTTIRLGMVLNNFKKDKKQYKKLFPKWNVNPQLLRSYDKFIKSMPKNVSMVKGQKWKGPKHKYKFIDDEFGEFVGTPTNMTRQSFKKGLTGHPKRGRVNIAKASSKKVKRSDGKIFNSVTDAARELGVHIMSVSKAINRGTKCKGYTFKYVK